MWYTRRTSVPAPTIPDPTVHPHAALITRFYEALQRRDGEAMAACYGAEATFSDPVFTDLRGEQCGEMWKMLCHRGKDLEVVFSAVQADDSGGTAHWDADYSFSATGNKVHNTIDATFTFKDGLIATHVDTFDLYAWCRQALGLQGVLLGWLPPVQGKLRTTAAKGLEQWMARDR